MGSRDDDESHWNWVPGGTCSAGHCPLSALSCALACLPGCLLDCQEGVGGVSLSEQSRHMVSAHQSSACPCHSLRFAACLNLNAL
jgi:hypothetical protein